MSSALVIVDPTQTFRDWLRTQNVGGVSSRVWAGGLPTTAAAPTLPAISFARVPGGGISSPLEVVAYQFDVWASRASEAAALAAALVTLLLTTGSNTVIGTVDGTAVRFAGVDETSISSSYLFDPDDPDVHRHMVLARNTFIYQPT